MKSMVGRNFGIVWLCLACLGLLLPPLAVSRSSQKSTEADEAYNRGVSHFGKGDYDKAIADYNEAIRLDPKHALAYYNRGLSYAMKGDHDKAIADYNEAIRLDPKDQSGYQARGYSFANKGDHDKAIADYNEAIRL